MEVAMKRGILLGALMLGCASIAHAQGGWTTRDGHPVPETESCRAVHGFCGQLIVTPDDWKKKWATPVTTAPRFTELKTVKRGQHLSVLTFYANPMLRKGVADVTCDIDIVRPNGAATHLPEAVVHHGPIGDPSLVFLSPQVVDFVGENDDPAGRWNIRVTLHDNVRRATVPLSTHFVLK